VDAIPRGIDDRAEAPEDVGTDAARLAAVVRERVTVVEEERRDALEALTRERERAQARDAYGRTVPGDCLRRRGAPAEEFVTPDERRLELERAV
jgi:hypothetical protein